MAKRWSIYTPIPCDDAFAEDLIPADVDFLKYRSWECKDWSPYACTVDSSHAEINTYASKTTSRDPRSGSIFAYCFGNTKSLCFVKRHLCSVRSSFLKSSQYLQRFGQNRFPKCSKSFQLSSPNKTHIISVLSINPYTYTICPFWVKKETNTKWE